MAKKHGNRKRPQPWVIHGDIAVMQINHLDGSKTEFQVDSDDVSRVDSWRWYKARSGYAIMNPLKENGFKRIPMHRLIVDVPKGFQVDHANRNPCDNRKANLRVATASENSANSKIYVNNTVGLKGVYLDPRATLKKRYQAKITVAGKNRFLGRYETSEEAARAYDQAAISHFGKFALTNQALGLL